jgi:hypothetical protein
MVPGDGTQDQIGFFISKLDNEYPSKGVVREKIKVGLPFRSLLGYLFLGTGLIAP